MRFVEETGAAWSEAQLKAAEAEIEAQKREWEANRLAARQKEEEMLQREAKEASPEDLLTYSRRDANNQVVNKSKQKEQATNIRKNTNISSRFAKRNRDNKLNVKKLNCRGGMIKDARKQAQTTMKNRVLNSRRKLAVRQMRRNRRNNQLYKNDKEEQESSENDEKEDQEGKEEEKITESIEKYSTRSTTSLEKEMPVIVKSKTGVKNQKLLNIARLKQNESKVIKVPTRRIAVVLTNTKRVLRNNTVRQAVNKSSIEERNTRTKNNINTQIVNFRNKLRSESYRSSENTEEDEAEKLESEQSAEETTDSDDDCNGIISNSQENTNSSTTYYNVSEEDSEDDESSEVEVEVEVDEDEEEEEEDEEEASESDKPNTKVLAKQILKSPLNCNIESETTPRTRSRGTVNIDLWTLDNSLLATNCHANVSRSSKKDTNEQNNVSKVDDSIDKKSKVYLKRRKTDDFESKPSKLTTIDHWITPTKNGSPNTFHDTDS